jgi:glutamate--cysteine ligase
MLELSREGLERRDRCNEAGENESRFLTPLQTAAESGQTFAEVLVQRFSSQWQGDIDVALAQMCKETFS